MYLRPRVCLVEFSSLEINLDQPLFLFSPHLHQYPLDSAAASHTVGKPPVSSLSLVPTLSDQVRSLRKKRLDLP